jgi:hypothetical protein
MLRKLNCHVARASVFLIAAALIAGIVGCDGGGYNPPPSKNLEILTWYDLDKVRDNIAGNHTLMNDLDSTTDGYEELASPTANGGRGWEPMGESGYFQFSGTFNGQGYEIRDLFINRPNWCTVGLFDVVGEGGCIDGVGVVNANVTGDLEAGWNGCNNAGILVGTNLGTVNNCYCTGSVTCEWPAGGLVGKNYGTVSNSYYSGNVTSNTAGGGLVGVNSVSDDYPPPGLNGGIVTNSYYDCDEVLINGKNIITIGALSGDDFYQWLANGKFLDINESLYIEDGYYLINDVSDFKQLLAFGQNANLKFRLTNDLDLATEPDFYIPYLAGEFDGNGHKISNLSLNFSFVSHVGLFGYLASGGEVRGLGIENVNINTPVADYAGGLVGLNDASTVSNCYATGAVTHNQAIHETGRGMGAGGLVGLNNGIVSDSYFSGSVTGKGDVGGLVGENDAFGTVINSYSTGTITGTWGTGGLVGHNWRGTVINSFSTGNVAGTSWTGGLVGRNDAFEDGEGTVSNSYSTGSVTGNSHAGGLIGGSAHGTVSNCYSTGSVSSDESVGGLMAFSYEDAVSNSFWDTQTSGLYISDGGTRKTTAQMKNITTFSGAGWNITAVANPSERNTAHIWNIVDDETYPFLSWQT